MAAAAAVPEQPKKLAGGAFGRYLAENRAALMEACKGQPITAVTKLASVRYKALGDAERATYEEKYKKGVQQYEKDMEAFLAAGGEKKAIVKKGAGEKPGRKEKDPEAPKKPVGGAYGIFQNENREAITKACLAKGEKGFGPVAKATSEAFKALSEADKALYDQKYTQKVAAYKDALAAHTEKTAAEGMAAAAAEVSPAAKRGRPAAAAAEVSPAAKRGRKAAAAPAPAGPKFEASVVKAAEKDGLLTGLSNLAGRPEIAAKGLQPMELLKVLKQSGGLVNKAKAALMAGA